MYLNFLNTKMSSTTFLALLMLLISSACSTLVFGQTRHVYPSSNLDFCDTINPPAHGTVEIIPPRYYYFKCEHGYKIQGNHLFSCRDYNTGKPKPECVKEKDNSEYNEDLTEEFKDLEVDFERKSQENTNAPIPEIKSPNFIPSTLQRNPKPPVEDPCLKLRCEQLCLLENGLFTCRCCTGYKLNPDNRTCRVYKSQRINKNKCLLEHKKVGDVVLRPCPDGYIFDYARNGCIEKSRRPPSVLRPQSPESRPLPACEKTHPPSCWCQNGYEYDYTHHRCIDVDECSRNNYDCSHLCVNVEGSAHCACPKGFVLDTDKKTCIDIDECSREQLNSCQHFCKNTVGSYSCFCKPGYILIEGYKCEGCRRNSYWSYETNTCVDCPKNSHTVSEGKTYIQDCVCDSGYTGRPGDYIPCEDIDECRDNNFGCSHECINIPGSTYCICPKGFMLDADNKTCIDIDECSIKNGGCEGQCINTEGSFECICPEGFKASIEDRYSCEDIDECSENNGGCEQKCNNYRGGFYCSCKDGYRLDNTLKNCTDIQCPTFPLPHFSTVNCKYKNTTLPDENASYPAGTKCTFTCGKGFKNTKNDNKIKCLNHGAWEGTIPVCRAQSCPPLDVPENGRIHPEKCTRHGTKVKQKCTFSCRAGYILEGSSVFTCKNDLTWRFENIPVCKPVQIQPVIKCPKDIQVTLLLGKALYNITVPEPDTNMEYYEVHPSWITVNKPVEFPVGVTQVTFTANSSFNEIAQCEMTVTVLDEEPPVFHFCPDSITIEGANGNGELVTWDEPVVTDNTESVTVFTLAEPNVTLIPGTYLVEYVARDSSGNIEKCSFNISIIRTNCDDLSDPAHGKANCMDFMSGKLCHPECEEGYMRNPVDSAYYTCDQSGVWEPDDLISDCLKYTLATSSSCEDGFEYYVDDTGEEICIECSSNKLWSPTTRKCEG